jgi:hypothetical protein
VALPHPLEHLAAAPVFIFGCARSGTTWVQDIFAAHPEVATISESFIFTEAIGVAPLLAPQHWAPDAGGNPVGLARLLGKDEFLTELRQFLSRVLGRAVGPQHRFLVEKSPNHLWVAHHIAEVFPEARFVHVIRDGRDVAVSLVAAGDSWAPHWKERSGSIRQAAEVWRRAIAQATKVSDDLGARVLEVRYEDLHRDPQGSIRRLFDFAEIPHDGDGISRIVDATDFFSQFVPDESGFRRGGRMGDWTTRFTPEDALHFQLMAGSTLIELGYEADDQWIERLAAAQ